jgi:hypothetical protein
MVTMTPPSTTLQENRSYDLILYHGRTGDLAVYRRRIRGWTAVKKAVLALPAETRFHVEWA